MDNKTTIPIDVARLFPKLERKLVTLLRGLSREQWESKATPGWRVKDVAAHLLDGNVRRLSIARDGYWGESCSGSSYGELVEFLDGLNADWVKAFRRVSPVMLIDLLEHAGREVGKYFESLDPHGAAPFPVAWAGEERSENWFDIAREYTERWHHQQQIREAVGQEGIMGRELYFPVIDTFMHALPVVYKDVQAGEGTIVEIKVTGRAGATWAVVKRERWELKTGLVEGAKTKVEIPAAIAWRLFTKGLTAEQKTSNIKIRGEQRLGEPVLRATAIMG